MGIHREVFKLHWAFCRDGQAEKQEMGTFQWLTDSGYLLDTTFQKAILSTPLIILITIFYEIV